MLRIKLIPLLRSITGKKHSSITVSAIANLELHSTLWVSPLQAASESSSDLWMRHHENPASSSCLVPRYFFKYSESCKSTNNIIIIIQKLSLAQQHYKSSLLFLFFFGKFSFNKPLKYIEKTYREHTENKKQA